MQINIILSKYSDIEVYTLFYGKGNTGSRLAKSIMREAFGLGGEALFPRPHIFTQEELKELPLKIKIGISIGKNDEDIKNILSKLKEGYRSAFIKTILKTKCMERLSSAYFIDEKDYLKQSFFEKGNDKNLLNDFISVLTASFSAMAKPSMETLKEKEEKEPSVNKEPLVDKEKLPDFKINEDVFIPKNEELSVNTSEKTHSLEGSDDTSMLDILGVDFG